MTDFQWLIGGEAGFGIMTTGLMMAKICARHGYSVFDYVEYPSLIRGGHNAYYVRAASEEIFSQKREVDILVALNRETIDLHKDELSKNAVVLFDPEFVHVSSEDFSKEVRLCPVPFLELAKGQGADKLMVNTLAVGASLALLSDEFSVMADLLKETFGHKGEEIVTLNTNTAKAGFEYVQNAKLEPLAKMGKAKTKMMLISGNEAVGMGAIKAGLKFGAIYPMTPINALMVYLVSKALKYSIVMKEPEDEISGINMALGASYAGVRSLVATSGGGFSLMTEALGLAAQAEVPIVIILGTRPGPATGLPTWTDQGDLRFALHAHQGDFPRVVVAPGDILESFTQTAEAFNLADKYQIPVIVLVDKYLLEGHTTIEYDLLKTKSDKYRIDRGKLLSDSEAEGKTEYKRYEFTSDGVSYRSIPGQIGGISLTGSDEHDEKGLYNETAEVRIAMMEKRMKKMEEIEDEVPQPELIGPKDAPLTLLAFGTTKLPVLEAMRILSEEGIYVNFLKVSFVSPFPTRAVAHTIKNAQKTLVVEANYTGQFEGLIKEKTGLHVDYHLRKFDGRPFYPEEIITKIKGILS